MPCEEPLVYGTNILRDPGFEVGAVSYAGLGPAGQDFPGGISGGTTPMGRLYWDLPTVQYITNRTPAYSEFGWSTWQSYDYGVGPTPAYSTSSPHSGTYFARMQFEENQVDEFEMTPIGGGTCSDPIRGYSARVEPGDAIVWGGWVRRISARQGTWTAYTYMDFYQSAANGYAIVSGAAAYVETGPITNNTWINIEDAVIAPATAAYLSCAIGMYWEHQNFDFSGTNIMDVDDCYLEIQP